MMKLLICLILGFSFSAQAINKKKVVASKKKIVAITFVASSQPEGKKLAPAKRSVKKIRKEVVDVAFGSTNLESDLEPLKTSDSDLSRKSKFIGPPAPTEVLIGAYQDRQVASLKPAPKVVISKEVPSLQKLLQIYQKGLAHEAESDLDGN